ncbi:MAG TPA: hypothetical protein VH208_01715 [Myxococcaceae bacterium]|nr:hypothetical protein [Myxococcaceae bacterium]
MTLRFRAWLALGALLALSPSCHSKPVTGQGCHQDSDCGSPTAAWRCETSTGSCYCRTDQACPPSQFCNPDGFCQDRTGCQSNGDCPEANQFCDTTTSTCLPIGRCNLDIQCPLGTVCDTSSSTCVKGCRSNGDCAGISCLCDGGPCNCTGTTQADRQSCLIGKCDSNFCADNSFCQYGWQCGIIPDAGVPYSQCYNDYDPVHRPYCANCTFGGGTNTCGEGPNYCLIDTTNAGAFYCGSDCSQGQSCPRGYACQDVIVVGLPGTTQCFPNNPVCPANANMTCHQSSDCKFGGKCIIGAGQDAGACAGQCQIGENEAFGFCTCLTDNDCPNESCNAGECNISRRPCITSSDCHFIHCVDFQGAGGCWIGENCAPDNGLTCLQVR